MRRSCRGLAWRCLVWSLLFLAGLMLAEPGRAHHDDHPVRCVGGSLSSGRGVGGRVVAAVAVGDTPKEARRWGGLDALDVAAHFQIAVRVVGIRDRHGNPRVALYVAVFLPLGGVREPQQLAVPVEPYRTHLHRTVGPGRRQVSVKRAFKQIVVTGGSRNHIRSYLDLFCADDSGGIVERRVWTKA